MANATPSPTVHQSHDAPTHESTSDRLGNYAEDETRKARADSSVHSLSHSKKFKKSRLLYSYS